MPQGRAPRSEHAGSAALQSISRDIVAAESLPEYEKLQRALRRAQRAEVRYAIRHPELGRRWLLTRVEPATLASGKRTTSVVTLDITEQHQSQQRSEQLLRELSTILESTTAGIAYLRGDALVRCNRRFELMLGWPEGAALGCGVQELFAHNPQAARIAADAAARWPTARSSRPSSTCRPRAPTASRAGIRSRCGAPARPASRCRDDRGAVRHHPAEDAAAASWRCWRATAS